VSVNIINFWQAIEAMTPQDAWNVNAADLSVPVYGIKNDQYTRFPWEDKAHLSKPLEPQQKWIYDAQCGIYNTLSLSSLVVQTLGREVTPAEETSNGRLFDIRFDRDGMPIAQSFALSLSAWSAGQILREDGSVNTLLNGGEQDLTGLPEPDAEIDSPQSGFAGFDALSMALTQWIANEVTRFGQEGTAPGVAWLHEAVQKVAHHANLPVALFLAGGFVRLRASRVRLDHAQDKSETSEGLASFYAADLRNIAAAVQKRQVGAGLVDFLKAGQGMSAHQRIDVRDSASNEFLADALSPSLFPKGRWPSSHALAFSQQLAVNCAFQSLGDKAGLFAVNGPPGTGKTTLLRDVIAQVVTERAGILVKLGSKAFGQKAVTKIGDVVAPYYPLHESIGGFSIVVATNGNGAAENVTLELPAHDAVPDHVANTSQYFPELAQSVVGKKSWALMAAPLGNRRNRNEFVSRFWWGKRKTQTAAAVQGTSDLAMREHLRAIASGSQPPTVTWEESVSRFKKAISRETGCRTRMSKLAALPKGIAQMLARENQISSEIEGLQHRTHQALESLESLQAHCEVKERSAAQVEQMAVNAADAARTHLGQRPGVWDVIKTVGKATKAWKIQVADLHDKASVARNWANDLHGEVTQLKLALIERRSATSDLEIQSIAKSTELSQLRITREVAESELSSVRGALAGKWVNVDAESEERERITPWADAAWLDARQEVFLAALQVHRAFLEANASQMGANLALACDWLAGKRIDDDLVSQALDSLCLVVPVVSATFASFPRMFARAKQETIGWLLVDEAGQAQAAHAACAIWRAKRTVMVGDPLQLEPVVTVAAGIENELARYFKIAPQWMPSWNSAQGLADQSARIGTWLGTVPGESLWIGCPLRLHRRCAPEMFRISNEIAYGGMMVYGTNYVSPEHLPATAWLDVKSITSEGHWVEAEGVKLHALLNQLIEAGVARSQIGMISPFRDCALRLRRIAKAFGLDEGKVGTVHTAQGKEADVVVLVLGGNPRSPGAKAWAASKPNLLNVAVSRAKKRLYTIGDADAWSKHSYFTVMAQELPVLSEAQA
jgi:hypothetical protein